MKTKTMAFLSITIVVLSIGGSLLLRAQEKPGRQLYEYALLKWDGPDKVQVFYPDKFDYFRVFEKGNTLPKNAHDEEYCVNLVVNNLAKDGWEPIQLHATRVMLPRQVKG